MKPRPCPDCEDTGKTCGAPDCGKWCKCPTCWCDDCGFAPCECICEKCKFNPCRCTVVLPAGWIDAAARIQKDIDNRK